MSFTPNDKDAITDHVAPLLEATLKQAVSTAISANPTVTWRPGTCQSYSAGIAIVLVDGDTEELAVGVIGAAPYPGDRVMVVFPSPAVFCFVMSSPTQTYTPALVQSGAVAATVTRANYQITNGWADVDVRLDVTGTGTGNNGITVSLPVASAIVGNVDPIGIFTVYDVSAGQVYSAPAIAGGALLVYGIRDSSGALGIGQAPNFAITSPDVVSFHVRYPVA